MPNEVYGSCNHAWHDFAQSWESRVVQVEGGCRYRAVASMSGVLHGKFTSQSSLGGRTVHQREETEFLTWSPG